MQKHVHCSKLIVHSTEASIQVNEIASVIKTKSSNTIFYEQDYLKAFFKYYVSSHCVFNAVIVTALFLITVFFAVNVVHFSHHDWHWFHKCISHFALQTAKRNEMLAKVPDSNTQNIPNSLFLSQKQIYMSINLSVIPKYFGNISLCVKESKYLVMLSVKQCTV